MKKSTLLVLRSFSGPLVLTFLISLFVLLMQFLWKYVDDLVGKGLGWLIILKLMIYVSVTLVPLALPLSILISSIMTFGNLAEHSELTAFKSAGISLQRIMRPLVFTTILICFGAFFFSNNILPVANLKMNALLYDVRQQKPALFIKEGIFYNGIDGYAIKVGKKDADGSTIHDIMIYDHTENKGNSKLIMAEKGRMVMSDDERYLLLTLNNGTSYEERQDPHSKNTRPLMRSVFEEQLIRFDLNSFKLTRTNEQLFKDNYQMLNLQQLTNAADSIRKKIAERKHEFKRHLLPSMNIDTNTKADVIPEALAFTQKIFLDNFSKAEQARIASSALLSAKNIQSMSQDTQQDIEMKTRNLAKHEIEWNRKFTLSFACLILFFIGAPLGAIIRKGGLGMPVVVSILFFVTYHIISISGEKFAREGVIPAYKGMWLSSIVLLPIGIFLTYKATTDSGIFNRESYLHFFRILTRKKS